MVDAHKNFAASTVATAPSPATSGTSLVVATGDGTLFPTAPFNATVWPSGDPTSSTAEIVRVTAVATDTLTIARAQEGTTARSIAAGWKIAATITNKTLADIEQAAGTWAPTRTSSDDEFDDSSGNSGTNNGLDARWAWRNQGTATITYPYSGWITLNCPSQASDNIRIIEQTLSDGTWDARITWSGVSQAFKVSGLSLIDGVNGDLYVWGIGWETGDVPKLELTQWTNVTTWNNTPFSYTLNSKHQMLIYLRIVRSGTSLEFWASGDGIGWVRHFTVTDAVGATKIGLAVNENTGSNQGLTKLHCDYFRKVA